MRAGAIAMVPQCSSVHAGVCEKEDPSFSVSSVTKAHDK